MKKNDVVEISRADLIAVLRDLDTIVVSIDRIGSCVEDVGREQEERFLLDFFDQWDVWKKLAEMRSKLSEPFSYELGEDNMSELERELQDTPYWRFSNRLPLQLEYFHILQNIWRKVMDEFRLAPIGAKP